MPDLRRRLQSKFNRELCVGVDPDKAVAMGAAIQVGTLSPVCDLDVIVFGQALCGGRLVSFLSYCLRVRAWGRLRFSLALTRSF